MDESVLFEQRAGHGLEDFLGTFVGQARQTDCVIRFYLDANKNIDGQFEADGETLKVYAASHNPTGQIYGVLIEPSEGSSIAVFRASLDKDGLVLELDLPDHDKPVDFSEAEQIRFVKISDFALEMVGFAGLWG